MSEHLLYYGNDRINSIVNDSQGTFSYQNEKIEYDGNLVPFYRYHDAGKTAVLNYNDLIIKSSIKYGVDSDFVRAIVYIGRAEGCSPV